jgi:hypothetical protein
MEGGVQESFGEIFLVEIQARLCEIPSVQSYNTLDQMYHTHGNLVCNSPNICFFRSCTQIEFINTSLTTNSHVLRRWLPHTGMSYVQGLSSRKVGLLLFLYVVL